MADGGRIARAHKRLGPPRLACSAGDLTPYVGQGIKLRLRFDSVNGIANNFAGWYLDDIKMTASP